MYAETPHAPRMALEGPSAFFWLFCCLREYSGLRFSDTRAIHRLFCLLPLSFCPQRKSALLTITPDHYCGRIDTARMEIRNMWTDRPSKNGNQPFQKLVSHPRTGSQDPLLCVFSLAAARINRLAQKGRLSGFSSSLQSV